MGIYGGTEELNGEGCGVGLQRSKKPTSESSSSAASKRLASRRVRRALLPLRRKARHEQGLCELRFPRATPICLCEVDPLASPFMRFWPLLLQPRDIKLVEVIGCGAAGNGDDEARDCAMHTGCRSVRGVRRKSRQAGGRVI